MGRRTDKICHYRRLLARVKEQNFHAPAAKLQAHASCGTETMTQTIAWCAAPALTAFVQWVLLDAVRQGVKTLYFLARDGLPMYRIAAELQRVWCLPVACRYLYCSRLALQRAIFCLDQELAMACYFAVTGPTSASTIFERMGLPKNSWEPWTSSISLDPDMPMEETQRAALHQYLERSDAFRQQMLASSRNALACVAGYLRQEGLQRGAFALVDSGWKGSMQIYFEMILHAGVNSKCFLRGYYFGLYVRPHRAGNEYYCYLFAPGQDFRRAAWFNTNLFEGLCSADHGMTVGYERHAEGWKPLLHPGSGNRCAGEALRLYEQYAKWFAQFNQKPCDGTFQPTVSALLFSLMTNPSDKEARLLGQIVFSEDTTAQSQRPMAQPITALESLQTLLIMRVYRRLTSRAKTSPTPLWLPGSYRLTFGRIPVVFRVDLLITRHVLGLLNAWSVRRRRGTRI